MEPFVPIMAFYMENEKRLFVITNIPVEVEQLKHYGLNSQHNVFKVVKADGKYLILESDYARLFMKRF